MTALECVVPQGVRLVSAGVDFQIDRAELEFVGWGEGEETWGLGNVMLPGDFSKMFINGRPWAYDQLESVLTREFIREDRARLSVVAAGFDTGYATAQRALYQYLRPRLVRRYYAMKGASAKWAPIWALGRREDRIRLHILGTNRLKALVYQRASITVPGPGYMHIPKTDDYDEEWFKQLLAEDSHTERNMGVEMTIFEMPTSPGPDASSRNEALDKRVYAIGALYVRGPVDWAREEAKNLATIPLSEAEQERKEKRAKRVEHSTSNWMGDMGRGFKV